MSSTDRPPLSAAAGLRRYRWLGLIVLIMGGLGAWLFAGPEAGESTCYGTPAEGRLQGGVRLPRSGANFSSYSDLGWLLGRTYVHRRVRTVLLDAFAEVQREAPEAVLVYGETGWPWGGSFRPHKTHRNGTSVDLMVPVLRQGRSQALPTSALNRWGYDIEFDRQGRYRDYRIDYPLMAVWLQALDRSAKRQGLRIARVIFDPGLQAALFATERGASLRALPFSRKPAWVRHDEHFHVDFALPCRPL